MDNKKLVNWAELNRIFGFDRGNIRPKKIYEKHSKSIKELMDFLSYWTDKYIDR